MFLPFVGDLGADFLVGDTIGVDVDSEFAVPFFLGVDEEAAANDGANGLEDVFCCPEPDPDADADAEAEFGGDDFILDCGMVSSLSFLFAGLTSTTSDDSDRSLFKHDA